MKLFLPIILVFFYSCSDSSESSGLVNKGNASLLAPKTAAKINSISIMNKTYTESEVISFLVTTNKNVTISGLPTLSFNIGGKIKSANYVNGSGTNTLTFSYTVVSLDEDLDGVELIGLNLNSGKIIDADELELTLSLPSSSTSNVKIKTSSATIILIRTPISKTFINGEILEFEIQFSEEVFIVETPSLELEINGSTLEAIYTSGNSTDRIKFQLLLPQGLQDTDGIQLNAIKLNSGSIIDSVNIPADLTFISPDLTAILVDSIIPTIDTIDINSGSLYTNANTATLNLAATDADEIYITQSSGCLSDGTYEAFLESKPLTLSQNTTNQFYVKVKDQSGNESNCSIVSITHDNLAPDSVSVITLGNNSSDIATDNSSWSASLDNGPSGVLKYEYAVSTSNDELNIVPGGTWIDTLSALSFQIDSGVNLTGGVDYYTLVRATDNAGNVSQIKASAAWNIIVSPEAITNLEASNKAINSLDLGWSYPNDNGTPIIDYEIQIKGGNFSDWTFLSDGISAQTSSSVRALDAVTPYQLKVRAFNGINYSAWSNTLQVKTLPNLEFFKGGFKAINISGAPKSKVVSFDDANEIHIDGNLVTTLQKGETYEFNSNDFTTIEGSKALYVAGKLGTGSGSSDQGNATWATQSWVGSNFYFNLTRMAPLKVKVFAFTDSEITIKTGAATVDTQAVSADSGHIFTLTNYANYQLSSTGLIVAFIYGNAGELIYDPQPLLPVSTDILGFPSSKAMVTSGTDNNSYSFYHSGGNSTNGTLSAATTLPVSPSGTSSSYQSDALRIKSVEAISANSNADGDGYCQAPFVPVSMLKKRFGLNVGSEWIALASDRPVTVTLTKPDLSTVNVVLTRTGSGKSPYKAYIATDFPEGTILEGTDKFQAWYQPYTTTYSGGDDETIMFGWDE
ncbi:MAG: hypothetical protein ACJAS4_000093 [Bacteriovoracaceae bacterium]